MFILRVTENQSGEVYETEISGEETIETHVAEWVETQFCGELSLVESDGYIPRGCGAYTAEIVDEDQSEGSCWQSFDFYLKHYEED